MTRYTVKIESDEDGFRLIVGSDIDPDRYTFLIEDPEALYDTVKAEIGPWLYERDMAGRYGPSGVSGTTGPSGATGQRMRPFLCSVEDVDKSGGYDPLDPKSSGWHERMATLYDNREKV